MSQAIGFRRRFLNRSSPRNGARYLLPPPPSWRTYGLKWKFLICSKSYWSQKSRTLSSCVFLLNWVFSLFWNEFSGRSVPKRLHMQSVRLCIRYKIEIKKHIKPVDSRTWDIKCSKCAHATLTNQTLKRYIKSMHKQTKNVKCAHCKYSIAGTGVLQSHI